MPRYIDADAVIKEIEYAQDSLKSNNDVMWEINKKYYKGLCMAHRFVDDTPTADVAQRAEVAREIFREIMEKGGFSDPCVLHIVLSFEELDEIEKKYTGGDDHMEKEKT